MNEMSDEQFRGSSFSATIFPSQPCEIIAQCTYVHGAWQVHIFHASSSHYSSCRFTAYCIMHPEGHMAIDFHFSHVRIYYLYVS
jgi:hypothetical protein